MLQFIKKKLIGFLSLDVQLLYSKRTWEINLYDFLQKNLYTNPKYLHNNRLNKYEYSVFSQNGEDGIIEEIFNRIGVTNKYFIEFGVGNGIENNSVFLLTQGWTGLWLEGNNDNVKQISKSFRKSIEQGSLVLKESFITSENINTLLKSSKFQSPDLLCVDLDRNDYYIIEAINVISPRVVILEYNAIFPQKVEFKVEYDAMKWGDGTSLFGASLKTYEKLMDKKGYKLVGCDFSGVNAFFVRNDLIENHFEAPYTSENHYESPKYLLKHKFGHERNIML